MKTVDLDQVSLNRLKLVRESARELRESSLETRNKVLATLADLIAENRLEILDGNRLDLKNLKPETTTAFRDRLTLTSERLAQMQESLNKVIALPDPINTVESERTLANGLRLKRVRAPLGVILMIFEARPNVITEAFSLALKSGNAFIMRGGTESLETAKVLYRLVESALDSSGLPAGLFWGITTPDRDVIQSLMKQDRYIDVLVPRGGDSLIRYVSENATIPVIKNDRGMCHVYVHADANDEMAIEVIVNAKTSRPGVCNSLETILIHDEKKSLLPKIFERLQKSNVEWFGDDESIKLLSGRPNVSGATEKSFDTEYLDFKINCRIVESLEQAIEHIETHGSRHSESILTQSEPIARKFQNAVDAAAVYWNASTRFTDGFEFGLGGELGISTQKLHVRGPVGLIELTSLRWIIDGTGQVRV